MPRLSRFGITSAHSRSPRASLGDGDALLENDWSLETAAVAATAAPAAPAAAPAPMQEDAAEPEAAAPAKRPTDDPAGRNTDDGSSVDLQKVVVKGRAAVDSLCPKAAACHVHAAGSEEDGGVFDALLNQTNIANNNNKFYIIQVRPTSPSSFV